MCDDQVVADVRKAREELAAEYGNDLAALAAALKKKHAARRRVVLEPRRVETSAR